MKKVGWIVLALLVLLAMPALAENLRVLSYNSTGEDVTALQERLTDLGYYSFRVTGVYQENTQKAVRAFQEDHGLEVTGTADAALQMLLFSADALPKATPVPAPTMNPADLAVEYPGKLQYNDTGDNVSRIQTRLKDLGYYGIEVSGQFLGNTRNAVKEFQRQNGLTIDGVVGQATWQALFFDEEAVDVYATPRPSPSPSPVPYQIGVDLTNQVTTIYGLDEGGAYTEVIKQMVCSTGTASDPTPPGVYTLNGATARWCYFPKWGTHAQYWTRIDAYNAFHSVIYSEADPMMLKTGSYTGLGKPASHGCIRLMVEDAKWIYTNCGKGTEVHVYESELDEELTKSLKIPPLDYSVMLPQPTAAPTQPPQYDPEGLPPMPFKTLERGTESEAVYWLQCKLADMGYYRGTITGGYYSGTADAVKAFQRNNGLSVDGKAGKNTLTMVYADVLATPSPEPTIDVMSILQTGGPSPSPTVKPAASASPSPSPTPYEIPSFFVPGEEFEFLP